MSRSRAEWVAWAAGVFDGEGCISIAAVKRRRTYYRVDLFVVNTAREMLEPFQEQFGGRIMPKRGGAAHHRQVYVWATTSCRHAEELLRIFRPWLFAKGPQADVAISACGLIGGIGERKSDATLAALADLKTEMHSLKGVASSVVRFAKSKGRAA